MGHASSPVHGPLFTPSEVPFHCSGWSSCDFTRGTNQQLQFLVETSHGSYLCRILSFHWYTCARIVISHILTVGFLWRRFSLSDTKASCFISSRASFNTLWWLVYRSDQNVTSAGLDWGCRKNSQFSPRFGGGENLRPCGELPWGLTSMWTTLNIAHHASNTRFIYPFRGLYLQGTCEIQQDLFGKKNKYPN